MLDRKKIKEKIPHGYGKIVAKKAGVTEKSVSDYLNSRLNSERIEIAALEVIAQIQQSKNQLVSQISW